MSQRLIVAIDGPASSGKSTSAKLVAQKLGYLYIDTGAMYRAITLLALRKKIIGNIKAVVDLVEKTNIELEFIGGKTKVVIDGEDISEEIRSHNVNQNVSQISKIEGVRTALVKKQKEMGKKNRGVVMEGRDIGTVVFPDAEVKIFLTAAIEQRAMRRAKEYEEKGITAPLNEIKKNIEERDTIDSTREIAPLVKAPDAQIVDTSKITIEEQVDIILEKVRQASQLKNQIPKTSLPAGKAGSE